jgi:hypothetical protein
MPRIPREALSFPWGMPIVSWGNLRAFFWQLLAFPRRVESPPQGTIGFPWGKFRAFLGNYLHSSR